MKLDQKLPLCACLSACLLFAAHAPAASADTNDTKALVAANTSFAFDLYARLKGTEGNLFFSPYGVSTSLGMACAGARGQTEEQMARVLHFGTNRSQTQAAFGALQEQSDADRQTKKIAFNVANGLWAQEGHPFLPEFRDAVRLHFQGNASQVDFRTNAEAMRKTINDWVSTNTSGRITNLFAPYKINLLTRLVLVNASYFKGAWARPFKDSGTPDSTFALSAEDRIMAHMMNATASFNYAEIPSLQILELPYQGGDLSMVILLPTYPTGFKIMENLLNASTLANWLKPLREQTVNVFVPRFKITSQFGLAPTLRPMGMDDAFTPAADFSGMDGARDLFVSDLVHKAFVEVNEEGSEAAAASGAAIQSQAETSDPIKVFRADHPFIFLIRDTHTGSILFLGRVMDPSK